MGIITVNLPRPRFDPTFNWGHILTAGTILAAVAVAWFALRGDIDKLDIRTAFVERSIDRMTIALQALADKATIDARQDVQIQAIDRRVDANERRIDRLTVAPVPILPR